MFLDKLYHILLQSCCSLLQTCSQWEIHCFGESSGNMCSVQDPVDDDRGSPKSHPHGGFLSHGGTPIYGWLISWKIPSFWMDDGPGGSTISGNLHIYLRIIMDYHPSWNPVPFFDHNGMTNKAGRTNAAQKSQWFWGEHQRIPKSSCKVVPPTKISTITL
jgi:hypothetical protein